MKKIYIVFSFYQDYDGTYEDRPVRAFSSMDSALRFFKEKTDEMFEENRDSIEAGDVTYCPEDSEFESCYGEAYGYKIFDVEYSD